MGRIQIFPLLIIPALLYALIAIPSGDKTAAVMASQAFAAPLPALPHDAPWVVSWGQLITMLSVVILFLEILKSTTPSGAQMIDNGLSVGVFIVCFVLWLLVRPFGTSEFFIIVLMCLLDFLAGSVIMTRVSQRTVQYDR
jgi:hypothetical protein